ncbi:MAG: hypothetical protein MUP55_02585 [Candidatus Aenigmarchaeota archaeon]|nr:hypothetical protein [Candidatus Aenigmarchaeota archaeon]
MDKKVSALILRAHCPDRPEFHNSFSCYILEDGKFKMPLYDRSPDGLSSQMIEAVKDGNDIGEVIRLEEERPWTIPNYADRPIAEKDFLDVLSKYKEKLERLKLV